MVWHGMAWYGMVLAKRARTAVEFRVEHVAALLHLRDGGTRRHLVSPHGIVSRLGVVPWRRWVGVGVGVGVGRAWREMMVVRS